jgi:hypothetical protein
VTFSVTNQGSRTARSTCRIAAVDETGSAIADESLLTTSIPAGTAVTVHHTLEVPLLHVRLRIRCV